MCVLGMEPRALAHPRQVLSHWDMCLAWLSVFLLNTYYVPRLQPWQAFWSWVKLSNTGKR